MLMIRLQRIGRKHDPAFRVVVTEKTRGPKSGDFIEKVGFYHAKTGEKSFNKERIIHWIDKGAQPSGTVHNFLVDEGVVKGKKINVLPKRKPVPAQTEAASGGEEKPEDAAPAPAPEAQAEKPAEKPAEPEAPKEETPAEEPKKEEAPAEESKEEEKVS